MASMNWVEEARNSGWLEPEEAEELELSHERLLRTAEGTIKSAFESGRESASLGLIAASKNAIMELQGAVMNGNKVRPCSPLKSSG